jgi:hypothetical protein
MVLRILVRQSPDFRGAGLLPSSELLHELCIPGTRNWKHLSSATHVGTVDTHHFAVEIAILGERDNGWQGARKKSICVRETRSLILLLSRRRKTRNSLSKASAVLTIIVLLFPL